MEEAALGFLGEISQAATLRHAVQLLTPAHVLAKTNGAPTAFTAVLLHFICCGIMQPGGMVDTWCTAVSRPCMCWLRPRARTQSGSSDCFARKAALEFILAHCDPCSYACQRS